MKTALDLCEIDGGMPDEVGGKAANLGELVRAGLPVPPGWVLTTEAYRQVADGLGGALDELVAAGGSTGGTALAARARALLLEAPVPGAVREEILSRYAALGDDVPVAVRSSATAEDLPFASFAGQQDTYLNVVGGEAVLDAVRRCWASLWTDRAVAYRESQGVGHDRVRLAVVVQAMVDARVAGVMFTANPVTGRRREAVIDAAPGLGDAVVSGAVDPDRFVVDVATGEIRERHAGGAGTGAGTGTGVGAGTSAGMGAGRPCLTDAEARELAALAARVEDHFGAPQDTEWALDHRGTLWLTQSRPITTLYPLPESRRDGLRVYFSFNVAQGVMGPLTPMGLSAVRLFGAGGTALFGYGPADPLSGPPVMAESGQRLWLDVTTAVRSRAGRVILPRLLTLGEARAKAVLDGLAGDPRLSVVHRDLRPAVRGFARFARRVHAPARVFQALARPRAALAYTARVGEELEARLRVPDGATPAERIDHAVRTLRTAFPAVLSIMPIVITGYGLFALASRLCGTSMAELQDVLRSVPRNPTTEMDLALWELATRVEPEPFRTEPAEELARRYRAGTLPPTAQREIAAFLRRYGHRGVAEIDLGVPRWSEDPAHVLGVLSNYLRADRRRMEADGTAPDALFARGELRARAAVERAVSAARRRGPLRAALTRYALGRTRMYAGLRELPKFHAVRTLAAVRASLLAVGAHLAAEGGLEAPEDVFFLRLEEARAALGGGDLRALVAERRQVYERESRRRHVPRVLLSDGTEPETLLRPAGGHRDGVLTGTPASAGTVTGPARVVLDPVGAHLEPGEVLVCPSTDPGWTPLFLTAGGLVMEMGGAMSHGAVVAREYGIPAVVGVPDATRRVRGGQEITVDGAAGTVTLPAAPDQPSASTTSV
ncbi:PEP/pyruvate-binding domain-containing protein [Nonomuraea pusilla]|uniref:Pyruvate, water dikinase n=1 Tax=Nonomuraea pusilla TaxID=46177 RepID=A0A1H7LLX9_9ACTN|nr:PEP/pyruvate-binding domain-containing protein [Nonomuraea pusilla]SEK99859.1 pyruvate, water dikinase [Nonomuraea pusilla]